MQKGDTIMKLVSPERCDKCKQAEVNDDKKDV